MVKEEKKDRASDKFFHIDKLKGTVLFILLIFAFVGFQIGIIPWVTAQTFNEHTKNINKHFDEHKKHDKKEKEKIEKKLDEQDKEVHKINVNVARIQSDVGHIKSSVDNIQKMLQEKSKN